MSSTEGPTPLIRTLRDNERLRARVGVLERRLEQAAVTSRTLALSIEALRPHVEDCLRYLSETPYFDYARVWDNTRAALTTALEERRAALGVWDAPEEKLEP